MNKIKNKKSFKLASILTGLVSFFIFQQIQVQMQNQKETEKNKPQLSFGLASAFGVVSANCETIVDNVMANEPASSSYSEPVLYHIHNQLYRFNQIETADIEMVMCHLVNRLGMNPDITKLPQTVTKTTKDNHTVVLTVTAPTETFATTNGYTAKAEVTYDGTQFLAFWWSGSGDTSKGYIIQGANPLQTDGVTRLKYALWDRSSTSQVVKIFATQFATTYLANPAAVSTSKTGGDRAHYARASYDTSTKAVTAQTIEIKQNPSSTSNFGCAKTMFSGIIGGTMSAYRPAAGTLEDPLTSTTTDGTHIDGGTGIQDSATANLNTSGTRVNAPATLPTAFDFSCKQIHDDGLSGGAFASGNVNYAADPATIFPH